MGGLGGGHYTAYIKSFKDGKWYEANDSFTTAIPDPNSIKSASAYVLFYRQRSAETRLNEDERFEFVEHAESQVVVPDAVDREDEDREFEMNQVQGDDFDSLYDFLS
jgi:ubiquitin carboxyl-terminal hydrolase 4/11/15